MTSDDELLQAWRAGDAGAAEQLFARHFAALYRFFRNKAPAGCDDLVQATFLGCFEAQPRFRGECSFRTYLFAIARNKLLAWLASQRQDREVAPPDEALAADGRSPSSVLHRRREQHLILAALRRLPVDVQILLELFYWESATGPELARILDAPEGTIRTRLRRARQLLEREIRTVGRQPDLVQSTLTGLDEWASALRDEDVPSS